MNLRLRPIALLGAVLAALLAVPASAQSARDLYAAALAREQALKSERAPSVSDYRSAVAAYEAVVRRYPASGYVDNALWQGAVLALEGYERFGQDRDQSTARRLFDLLGTEYRFSPLSSKAREAVKRIDAARSAISAEDQPRATRTPARNLAEVKGVRRAAMGDKVRVTIELDGPATYRAESLENPRRMFVDIAGTQLGGTVPEGTLTYDEEVVRKVRIGRHPNDTTRVVVDLDGIRRYTVSTQTNPYRILVDCERLAAPPSSTASAPPNVAPPKPVAPPLSRTGGEPSPAPRTLNGRPVSQPWSPATGSVDPVDPWSLVDREALSPRPPASSPAATKPQPQAPRATDSLPATARTAAPAPPIPPPGSYSLSRQLGLGASKIVIDPGHGGHDPGALGSGVTEAEIVLDVALRLEALLSEAGFDVVLTRRTDQFIALEERPAIATREQADLFLSIHANASRNRSARGIETYILNFATDPDAVAVAVRENASTERRMNNLPEIVKAITLNNKLDESRSFARLIQRAMAQQLRGAGGTVVDHGVKQAPFVVLIGAAMPSVLVEISFITHAQEGRLLKTPAYRQRIAQALFEGVRGYQKSLKLVPPEQLQ